MFCRWKSKGAKGILWFSILEGLKKTNNTTSLVPKFSLFEAYQKQECFQGTSNISLLY